MRVHLIITDVPEPIRSCVEVEAREREMPLTHVVCEVLAARYEIPWTAPNYKLPGTHKPGNWVMRVPKTFREALSAEAREVGGSTRGVFLMAMAEHCGLPAIEPWDRRRKTWQAAAVEHELEPIIAVAEARLTAELHEAGFPHVEVKWEIENA